MTSIPLSSIPLSSIAVPGSGDSPIAAAQQALSSTILADRLTPHTLGVLVALYEHSVFVQGIMWDIDSFDQWGVELGKVLAQRIVPELSAPMDTPLDHDSSTTSLIRRYQQQRKEAV